MRPVDFALYLIGDEELATLPARLERALGALPSGAAAVQLRAKRATGRALLDAARSLRAITRAHGAKLLVNDRLDVALAAGADGVHLPSRGLPVAEAKRLAPALLVGASTHSLDEARRAVDTGADFVTFGPVWATPSKRGMGEPVGVARLAEAASALPVPVYALGGVDASRAPACAAAGARLACVRAVLDAPSPADAARALLAAVANP